MEKADRLFEHRILSKTGRDEERNWLAFVQSKQGDWTYTHDQITGTLLNTLGQAATAYRTIQWYEYYADSLQRADLLPPPEQNTRKAVRLRADALFSFWSPPIQWPPPRTSQNSDALAWAEVDSAFAAQLRDLRWQLSKADPSLFTRYDTPQELLEELRVLGVVDSLLVEDIEQGISCKQVFDAASLLTYAAQCNSGRQSSLNHRQERVERILGMESAGYLNRSAAQSMLDTLGPYEWPSDYHLAEASSPHLSIECQGITDGDAFYTQILERIGGIVENLHPVDVRITRSPANQLRDAPDHLVEVSFKNDGRSYAVTMYDGGPEQRGEFRTPGAPGYCFMTGALVHTLNKALCDAGAEVRVAGFEDYQGKCGEYSIARKAFAFLDKAQCDIWWPDKSLGRDILTGLPAKKPPTRGDELFSKQFCRDSIHAVIDLFRAQGILNHLGQPEITASFDKANRTALANWAEVLLHFPDVAYDLGSRSSPWQPGALEEQLEALARISHGKLSITEVKERWLGPTGDWHSIHFSFTANGKRYRADRDPRGVYSLTAFRPDLIPLANQALQESSIDGRFCALYFDREPVVIFLNRAQYDVLRGRFISRYYGDPWATPPAGR